MLITKQKSEFRIWTESFAKQQSVWLYASNGTAPDEAKLRDLIAFPVFFRSIVQNVKGSIIIFYFFEGLNVECTATDGF